MESYKDFLMIISPPDEVIKQISKYKRASANKIGPFKGMHSIAHISITYQQRCKPFMADPFMARLENKLQTMQPAEIYIKNFKFFTHGTVGFTIYAEVNVMPPNHNWFKLLRKQMGITITIVPHITVLKNIPPSAFKKLWPYFENSQYEATFKANSLTILWRETFAEQHEWRPYKELFFGNRLMPF
ncbi:2'-5' RNA ligase family protein [Mucilaginibacter calamicampi]|uniref:2'-5' RNA ligase family protein n=1 Tax=Mucilaginibacter calamicampi TaxID=1302352 RepID=A0ABW2YVX2_9SPHI